MPAWFVGNRRRAKVKLNIVGVSPEEEAELLATLLQGFNKGEVDDETFSRLQRYARGSTHRVWLGDRYFHLRLASKGHEGALLHDHEIRLSLPDDIPHQRSVRARTSRGDIGLIQEHIEGVVLRDALRQAETTAAVAELFDASVDLLKKIHKLNPTPAWHRAPDAWPLTISNDYHLLRFMEDLEVLQQHTLVDPWLVEMLPPRLAYLLGQSGMENLGLRDSSVMPINSKRSCAHCDFHPGNLILPPDKPLVALDWERAMVAHPLIDSLQFLRIAHRYTDLINPEDMNESLHYLIDPPVAGALALEAIAIQQEVAWRAQFCREHPEYSEMALAVELGDTNSVLYDLYSTYGPYRQLASNLLVSEGVDVPDVLFDPPTPGEAKLSFQASMERAHVHRTAEVLGIGRQLEGSGGEGR